MDLQMVPVLDGWNQDNERQRKVTCFGDEGTSDGAIEEDAEN